MIVEANRSILSLFSPDEGTLANALMWKNLLLPTCTAQRWEGDRAGKRVAMWCGKSQTL
jgi:hypothetical protein